MEITIVRKEEYSETKNRFWVSDDEINCEILMFNKDVSDEEVLIKAVEFYQEKYDELKRLQDVASNSN
jgi:hypothetical protein